MVLEGSVTAYINAWLYKEFLDEGLSTLDARNILQENLFITLTSVQMASLSRFFAVLCYTISVPMRWLAGKSHSLSLGTTHPKKKNTAIDRLFDALSEIERDGKKILDEEFMMNIIDPLNLPPLDDCMKFVFEIIKSPTTNRNDCDSKHSI